MFVRALGTLVLVGAALPGQTDRPLAYPQERTSGSYGNQAAFGTNTRGQFDEARWQQLIPAQYLPARPCDIVGLEVSSLDYGGPTTYDQLVILVGTHTRSQLSQHYSQNMWTLFPSLNAVNFPVTYTSRGWTRISFQRPFAFVPGTGNLVIEVRKKLQGQSLSGTLSTLTVDNPRRSDLPTAIHSSGVLGSGKSLDPTADYTNMPPTLLRLVIRDQPTLSLRSAVNGTSEQVFRIGTPMDTAVRHAAGDLYWTFMDVGFLPAPRTLPMTVGDIWLPGFAVFNSGLVGPGGEGLSTFNIPANPALAGGLFTFQSLILHNGSLPVIWTNAVAAVVNP